MLSKIYDLIFPDLVSFLGVYHGVKYSDRYWRIVIDHWLLRTIDFIQLRYKKIEKALAFESVSKVIVPSERVIDCPESTSIDFFHTLYDEPFSALVDGEIIRILALKFTGVQVEEKSLRVDGFPAKKSIVSSRSKVKIFLESFANFMTRILCRDTDAFFLNTYLPRFKEFLLQISFGQVPSIYKVPPWTANLSDLKTRNLCIGSSQTSTDLENCVRNLIFKLIPKCYLEDYKMIDHLADKIHWPKNPKFICTANDYDTNDFFKIWAAKKVEGGTPYYVIQHGNNFESSRYIIAPEIEYSDRYITWGWNHKANCAPGFVVRGTVRRSDKYKKSGTLLMMASFLKSNIMTETKAEWNSIQISDQKKFLKLLNFEVQEKLVFRILRHDLRLPETLESWKDFFAEAKINASIESSTRSLSKSFMCSRVVVFAYFSTGFLECLAVERPAICFWQNDLNYFADCVIEDFRQLERVGLIHFTPESAAKHVNKHWDDVLSWWNNPEVKCVRQDFAEKYARYSSQPVKDLKKLLT
jgi:putative transferase (TIGR04331 family)